MHEIRFTFTIYKIVKFRCKAVSCQSQCVVRCQYVISKRWRDFTFSIAGPTTGTSCGKLRVLYNSSIILRVQTGSSELSANLHFGPNNLFFTKMREPWINELSWSAEWGRAIWHSFLEKFVTFENQNFVLSRSKGRVVFSQIIICKQLVKICALWRLVDIQNAS